MKPALLSTQNSELSTPTNEELRARGYPEVLLDLLDLWVEDLVVMGERPERARAVAFGLCERTRAHLGGEQLYIAKGRFFELCSRDREIYDKWNGQNTHVLCQQFQITERHIYRIVEAVRKEEQELRQGKLFTRVKSEE